MITKIIKKLKLKKLKNRGLQVGENFVFEKGVIIDPSIPWLIRIGNNVTLAPYVHILAHDASTKTLLGYTKIGKVNIGNNVFVGTKSVILPNVKIGNNVIISAGAVVTKDVPDGIVVGGTPAKELMTTENYIKKHKKIMNKKNTFKRELIKGKKKISNQTKKEIIKEVYDKSSLGYID